MNFKQKICSPNQLSEILSASNRPLVMTNGVFDVLHTGHLTYLEQASRLGQNLLVAVNSDASVRTLNKGPDRPVNSEQDRALMLAALGFVDWVTIFEESTPLVLLSRIKPDVYVKGGDYDMATLEEARCVREWGGRALSLGWVDGVSTTALLQRWRQHKRRVIFLDRDGVLNVDKGFVHLWQDFEWKDHAIEGLLALQGLGYDLVVVTNQSGLARGLYGLDEYQELTRQMKQALVSHGIHLLGVYHCPHHPEGIQKNWAISCHCRKPMPGLIMQAALDHGISLRDSIMVGDRWIDIEAGRAAGVGSCYLMSQTDKEASSLEDVPSVENLVDLAARLNSCPAKSLRPG